MSQRQGKIRRQVQQYHLHVAPILNKSSHMKLNVVTTNLIFAYRSNTRPLLYLNFKSPLQKGLLIQFWRSKIRVGWIHNAVVVNPWDREISTFGKLGAKMHP